MFAAIRFSLYLAITGFAAFFSTPSFAGIPVTSELKAQRDTYIALSKRIRGTSSRHLNTLVDDIEAMRDYPLFPYLYYELVNRNINYTNRVQIEAYLRDIKDVPIRKKLLKKWLTYLAKNNYKTLFLKTYEAGLGTELLCRNLHIERIENGVSEPWYQQVEVIWLSGYSLPDACNPVLAYWRENGKLSSKLAIGRMTLAGKAGQGSLANYLKRYSPNNAHYIVDLWAKVKRNPSLSLSLKRFPFTYPKEDQAIIEWGLIKMSWRAPEKVIDAIPKWQKSGKLSEKSIQKIKETLAISLTLSDDPRAKEWLLRAASDKASHSLWRWYLLNSVKEQDWSAVIDVVKTAPPAQRTSSEFTYWFARALLKENKPTEANKLLLNLAQERHYYGFMAAAYLQQPPALHSSPLVVESSVTHYLKALPSVLRARELFALERYVDARREWFALFKTLDEKHQLGAISLAHQWEWHDQAIVGALRVGETNDLELRFPLAFQDDFKRHTAQYNVDPSFALAIGRRESSFMVDAVSSVDARGIMQLLPSTAQYIIDADSGIRPNFRRELSRASIKRELLTASSNIELGINYLQFLEKKMGDNPVLIAAAYNAGWSKAKSWLPEGESIPQDIWIDTIPFKETREYVKAILTYEVIYDWQRQQPLTRFNDFISATIEPRNN